MGAEPQTCGQRGSSAPYGYDVNGNMTTRDGDTLDYDVENRLTSVTKAGVMTSFLYNGDGARVKKSVQNGGTTYYIGNYFEVYVSGSTTFNKYYYPSIPQDKFLVHSASRRKSRGRSFTCRATTWVQAVLQ